MKKIILFIIIAIALIFLGVKGYESYEDKMEEQEKERKKIEEEQLEKEFPNMPLSEWYVFNGKEDEDDYYKVSEKSFLLIKEMEETKNKEYEMEVGCYDTVDEMLAEYLKTLVSIKHRYTQKKDNYIYNANCVGTIYDIKDGYMYILTVNHIFDFDNVTSHNIKLTFVDNKEVTITKEDVKYDRGTDTAVIKIPLNRIDKETLNIVKTINLFTDYDKVTLNSLKEQNFYAVSRNEKYLYNKYILNRNHTLDSKYFSQKYLFIDDLLEEGMCGGGILTKDGEYITNIQCIKSAYLYNLYFFKELLE